jgi:hypothetical protein
LPGSPRRYRGLKMQGAFRWERPLFCSSDFRPADCAVSGGLPALPSSVEQSVSKTLSGNRRNISPPTGEFDAAMSRFDYRFRNSLFRFLLLIVVRVSAVSSLSANNNVKARSFGGGL